MPRDNSEIVRENGLVRRNQAAPDVFRVLTIISFQTNDRRRRRGPVGYILGR
jgi:hypothetical protein